MKKGVALKRAAAFLCVLLMTLSMSSTLLAQPSVNVSGIVTGVSGARDADGNAVQITISNTSDSHAGIIDEIRTADGIRQIAGSAYADGMQLLDVKYVTVPGGSKGPVTVTFNVTGITAGAKVLVLYYDEAAGKWITVECQAGDGTITAVLPGSGLVAFVADTGTKSPETGDTAGSDMIPIVLTAAAALVGAGLILYSRKKKA